MNKDVLTFQLCYNTWYSICCLLGIFGVRISTLIWEG